MVIYRWPEVGLPWRGEPPNPPQMPSSTSWVVRERKGGYAKSTWYLNQLGTTESGRPNVGCVHVVESDEIAREKMNARYALVRQTQDTVPYIDKR